MTDSSLLSTHNAAPMLNTSVTPSISQLPASPIIYTNGVVSQDDGDAEEGAIKCICSNPDDDGNTVMCDKCETWQHIVCYYVDRVSLDDDDSHFCVDCQPRKIDAKAADERQKAARAPLLEEPAAPRRTKPGPKKKSRKADNPNGVGGTGSATNGLSNGHASPRNGTDGTTQKKRGGHRPSASTSNIPLKIPTKRTPNSTLQSPLKSPHSPPMSGDPNKEFSPEFMLLYKNDSGEDTMAVSQFDDLSAPGLLADWSRNANALASITNGKTHDEIFIHRTGPILDTSQPLLAKHHKEDRNITAHGTNPQWMYITVENDMPKDSTVGELIGKIGNMRIYTKDPVSRWEYLRHPLPFVFFHPQLPIIIDTREEGSIFRYLRRSCEPNLTMKTILDDVLDYHFCFTASRDIKTGTELTIPWTLDEHVRRYFTLGAEVADVDEEYVSTYTRRVLAEFGGCACNSSSCVMAQWAGWSNLQHKPSRSRKKAQKGFGSRSSSEAVKQAEDDEMEDATAASNSSRSKPQSRDNTPSSMVDTKNILGEPISEREKRKIEALERSANQPAPKKSKRKSGDGRHGNPPPTPGIAKRGSQTERDPESPAAEGAFRVGIKKSPSPLQANLSVPPPLPLTPKPVYAETGCQADLDCSSLSQSLPSPTRIPPRRPMSSLHRRVFRKSVLKSDVESPKPSPVASPESDRKSLPNTFDTPSDPIPTELQETKDSEGDVKMANGEEAGLGIQGAKLDLSPIVRSTREAESVTRADSVSSKDMGPPPTPKVASPVVNGDDQKDTSSVSTEKSPVEQKTDAPADTSVEKASDESSKEKATPTLASHLSKEADAAPTPSKRKKKINLSQYLARRSSSNVSSSEVDIDNGGLSAPGADEAARSLSPLREEVRENGNDGSALETPKTEKGDPMITT